MVRRTGKRKEASDAVEQEEVNVRAVERSPSISSSVEEEEESSEESEIEVGIDSGSDEEDRSEDTRQEVGSGEEDEEDKPRRSWAAVMDSDSEEEGSGSEEDTSGGEEEEFGTDEDENEDEEDEEEDLASDSSEEERENVNTIGENIPLKWYEHERHIGYDVEGKRLQKQTGENKASTMDFFLDKQDGTLGSKSNKVWDEYNQRMVELTKEEMKAIRRIRKGMFPHLSVDPFPDLVPWATKDKLHEPMVDLPEPKSRFLPSKWEAAKVVKLVRAMRKGWIKPPSELEKERKEKEEESNKVYMLWSDDNKEASWKAANGLSYVPATKFKLPGHAGSYNPPKEYLEDENEDDKDMQISSKQSFDCLRKVPAYDKFVNEQFERCLDLYLCPRMRSRKGNRTAENLQRRMAEQKAKLPKPSELKPYPRKLAMEYEHDGDQVCVNSVCVDPSGRWLATAADDGVVRVFEVATTRCVRKWVLPASEKRERKVTSISWCPNGKDVLVAVRGHQIFALPILMAGSQSSSGQVLINQSLALLAGKETNPKAKWSKTQVKENLKGGAHDSVCIDLGKKASQCSWHHKGDYFATVCPSGNNMAVLVHQLSKCATQTPFNKSKGNKIVSCEFHPSKPVLFVASENHVRAFHLVKQELVAKLVSGSGSIISMAVHPLGDNIIVGTTAERVEWFDLDLSGKAYKVIRNHSNTVQDVAFHGHYPLFASASDDGQVHIFHGMVYNDFETNPLIVPVKILKNAHHVTGHLGAQSCCFHPQQPWIFTAGADGKVKLYVN
ncbi:ribosome biogenesis protein BOP1 [Chloropicon primus]|uniref:Ribosome biogenesis protein BOP1 homolog n=2 Tax=Chloropicon primus TaxID=1764295 RepID=A0A5B8MNW5_9CHLO|nr:ribosome biogenesis protein BOP1 [Chloropicon primus]UPR00925.1 ribosome biogenesis protein BOP1 [Chloropicon primus]|eukprot:QDZ21704.1 ribosome biogenesis protein BOP1 [Chloropicon primus]